MLKSLHLRDILSFRDTKLDLGPVTILIGPNGAGKSNLIDAIRLLRECGGRSLAPFLEERGGIMGWRHRNGTYEASSLNVGTEFVLDSKSLKYEVEIAESQALPTVIREILRPGPSGPEIYFQRARDSIRIKGSKTNTSTIESHQTLLGWYRSPSDASPTQRVAAAFSDIQIYTAFETGTRSQARSGSPVSFQQRRLNEDGSNLALILQRIGLDTGLDEALTLLNSLSNRFSNIKFETHPAGFVQLSIVENDRRRTLSTRLSDGTLDWLCLYAALNPPSHTGLICIEEPERGLHPDALHSVAELIKKASCRGQIVVTTHSVPLVNEFSDRPEAVVVCEPDEEGVTVCTRQDKKSLKPWLERYSMGELWRQGLIGGNRY